MTESKARWLHGLPMAEYLELDAIGSSDLREFARTPAHYRYHATADDDPTPAMKLGAATHLAILEPGRFADSYAVLGVCEGHFNDGRTCSYAAKVLRGGQSFCGRHDPGEDPDEAPVEIITAEHHELCLAMADAVQLHPEAERLIHGAGIREASATFEACGVSCRIRPDVLTRTGIHVSLKTTGDAGPETFGRHAGRMGYHTQLAFYRLGLLALGVDLKATVVVAVESAPPCVPAVYIVEEADLDAAQVEVERLLHRLAMCKAEDDWPGYGGMKVLRFPPWLFRRNEDDEG